MIVVDTNVIAYLFIPGEHTELARTAWLKDSSWSAPHLWRSEFRSVLSLYIRKKYMSIETAGSMMHEAENILKGNEYPVSSADIISLIASSKCSAYDCEFIALAKQLNTILITSDKQILREFPGIAIPLADFSK